MNQLHPIDFSAFPQESVEDLYEHAPCGYASTLPDGTIIRINQTLLGWLGFQKEEIMHKRLEELFSRGGRIFYETHHLPMLRLQGFIREINYDLIRKDASQLPVLVNATMVNDKHGVPLLIRTMFVNITERKKYEIELLNARKKAEKAARAKSEFLSTISHEIRTPMNAVVGIAHLLQEQNPAPHQQEYLRILKFSAKNLLNLINDILDFSRIESGKVALEEKDFQIWELVGNIMAGLRLKAEEKGLAVDVRLDPQIPQSLMGDALKIGQILTNLVGNAIKFTEKGSVSLGIDLITYSEKCVTLRCSVQDTGIGIAADKLETIFEEFAQADQQINHRYGGTGLGLSISQKLLALMESKVTVESELGKGSCFSFKLTLQQSLPSIMRDFHKPPPLRESLRGIKVLLAEDNAINILIVVQFLKKWGVEYDLVKTGALAVEKCAQVAYDLVLMDLHLPEMDGYEASHKIRERPYGKHLPIIAFSASHKLDVIDRLHLAGINDFVSKPFDPQDLYDKINTYARRLTHPSSSDALALPNSLLNPKVPQRRRVLNLAPFRKMTDHQPESMKELIETTIEQIIVFKNGFRLAIEKTDLIHFEKLTQQALMVIRLLEASHMEELIFQAKILLLSSETNIIQSQWLIQEVEEEIEALIVELKNALTDMISLTKE
jgi:PAS domain S-box-containing protein